MGKVTAVTILDNEQFLRQISQEVQEFDENLLEEIKILEDYCKENEVMAMALVQLGIPKRIIYLKNTNLDLINKLQENKETDKDYNEQRILINPRIVSREGLTSYYEACASCLDNLGLVRRPYKIEVCYQDLNQLEHQETFLGFESTVLSHEMDHLDGILHIDIADEILVMDVESRKKFRQKNGYQIISKTGNYEELLKKRSKGEKMRKDYLSWDEYFMAIAKLSSLRSKDPSTQVGACIVDKNNRILSIGYNGTPNGFEDSRFPWQREGDPKETKYYYVVHAERNAILNYRGSRKDLEGAKIYVDLFPCNECAKEIIQSGIKEVIYLSDKYANTDETIVSKRLFDECKVVYRELDSNNQNIITINLKK